MILKFPVHDASAEVAATELFRMCSPLNYGYDREKPPIHRLAVNDDVPSAPFLSAPARGYESPWAASQHRRSGPTTLACLLWLGRVLRKGSSTRPAPDALPLLNWLITQEPTAAPEELLWFSSMTLSTSASRHSPWFSSASPNLTPIRDGYAEDPGVVFIGDSAEDFALALAYDRMLGFGLWLTPEAIREHFATNWSLRFALEHTIESTFSVGPFPVESASLSDEDTANLIGDLLSAPSTLRLNGRPVETEPGSVLMIRKPVLKRGLLMLALIDHLGERPAVPVFSDASGTLHFQTPVASVLPEVPEAMMPLDGSGSPQWVVDVSLDSPQMPSGRGLHSKWVLEENEQAMTTLIRSSRAGISFLATTHGFVVNGTVIRSRLATPKIRQLGMYSWVQAMAEAEGCQVEYSRPGRFAALVASRLGSRERLIQIASGPLLRSSKSTSPARLPTIRTVPFPLTMALN